MKKFPSIFVNGLEEKLSVVYTGDSLGATPWFSAVSVEALLCVKNPYGTANNRVNTVRGRIMSYLAQHPEVEHVSEGTNVVLLGSVKPAKMFADDGQYSILSVMSSSKATAKPSYYYNEAALFYVLTTAKTDTANELQHWVNSVVLPTIRKTGEYNTHRKDGIGIRRTLTDAIKLGIDNNELKDTAYSGVTDAVYFIRYGVHTDVLRKMLQADESENIREKLDQDELDVLARLESDIAGGINLGMPLEQILTSARLIKIYRRSLL